MCEKIREFADFDKTYSMLAFPDMGDLQVSQLFSDHVIAGFR